MASYAGFETEACPGLAQLAWLKAHTSLCWCGYYLAPAPGHRGTSWVGQRQALWAQGWGVAPIFVGQQASGPGAHRAMGPQGNIDGAVAAELARSEGFPPQSCIFLDWEDGSSPITPARAYISAWAHTVAEAGYMPGVHCSHELAPCVAALIGPFKGIWACQVATTEAQPCEGSIQEFADAAPAGIGDAVALAWQYQHNCVLSLPGAPISRMQANLSCASVADPGAPR